MLSVPGIGLRSEAVPPEGNEPGRAFYHVDLQNDSGLRVAWAVAVSGHSFTPTKRKDGNLAEGENPGRGPQKPVPRLV